MGKLGLHAASVRGVGFKAALGNNANIASGNSLVITTVADIAVGDLVVVRVAADNLSATTPTFSCVDSGGVNSYTAHAFQGVNATAAAGVCGGILASKATAAVASGGTITVSLSGSVVAKAAYAESFTGFNNTLRNAVGLGSGASASPSATSGSATAGDLVVGCVASETRAPVTGWDTDTTTGSWSTGVQVVAAATGTDAARVEVNGQNKVVTGSGAQTFNLVCTNTDWAALVAVFQAA